MTCSCVRHDKLSRSAVTTICELRVRLREGGWLRGGRPVAMAVYKSILYDLDMEVPPQLLRPVLTRYLPPPTNFVSVDTMRKLCQQHQRVVSAIYSFQWNVQGQGDLNDGQRGQQADLIFRWSTGAQGGMYQAPLLAYSDFVFLHTQSVIRESSAGPICIAINIGLTRAGSHLRVRYALDGHETIIGMSGLVPTQRSRQFSADTRRVVSGAML